jgi:uncharacterized membrane protein
MTMARSYDRPANGSRWLLLGSLALNLFFVGLLIALLGGQFFTAAPPSPALDRSVTARVERIAATLPSRDAEILRTHFRTEQAAIEKTRDAYRGAQDVVRQALRAQPFDAAVLNGAMTGMRSARQAFDSTLQAMLARAAAAMSPEGRSKLADWPPQRADATKR